MTSDTSNLYASAGGGSIIEEWINYAGGKMATASLGKGMGLKDVTGERIGDRSRRDHDRRRQRGRSA